jgi:dTDP-glucose 4,6-dehydratase
MKNILITGGAGFIGSHLTKKLVKKYPEYNICVVDKLTYAGDLANLEEVKDKIKFYGYDICEERVMDKLFELHEFDGVFHLAAESHVDNSIKDPLTFAKTNLMGTAIILDNCLKHSSRLVHISTDEVYGSLDMDPRTHFYETNCYRPNSPYAASKAGADHLVYSYFKTYGLDCVITNCSNNYGSHQHPEKLIPLAIKSLINNRPIPVYGSGENVRDWIFVEDHVEALDLVFHKGQAGESYNFGGGLMNEISNIELIKLICREYDKIKEHESSISEKLISFVQDRKGHDMRYSVNHDKATLRLRWKPKTNLNKGLTETIEWYVKNYENNDSI